MAKPTIFTVTAAWDSDASVWSGHCDDIPAAADAPLMSCSQRFQQLRKICCRTTALPLQAVGIRVDGIEYAPDMIQEL
jgi:Domain of unknown function (DUF1902)